MSEKQTTKTIEWNKITDERFEEVGRICLWCGKPARREEIDGHHIERRNAHNFIKENCFPVHRYACHLQITDENVDVKVYPTKLEWEKKNESK